MPKKKIPVGILLPMESDSTMPMDYEFPLNQLFISRLLRLFVLQKVNISLCLPASSFDLGNLGDFSYNFLCYN